MSNNNNASGGLLLILLILLGVFYYNIKRKKDLVPPVPVVSLEEKMTNAEANGVKFSPTMASIRKDLQKCQNDGILILTIKPGKLTNPILGQTSISIDAEGKVEATITMDVEDAITAGDMEEPLLGHEFKHVWDALFLYDKANPLISVTKFIETANKQKNNNTLYQAREVESSAIGIEDTIRKELISSNNTIFAKLPRSRQAADLLYSQKAKTNPSIQPHVYYP